MRCFCFFFLFSSSSLQLIDPKGYANQSWRDQRYRRPFCVCLRVCSVHCVLLMAHAACPSYTTFVPDNARTELDWHNLEQTVGNSCNKWELFLKLTLITRSLRHTYSDSAYCSSKVNSKPNHYTGLSHVHAHNTYLPYTPPSPSPSPYNTLYTIYLPYVLRNNLINL